MGKFVCPKCKKIVGFFEGAGEVEWDCESWFRGHIDTKYSKSIDGCHMRKKVEGGEGERRG